MSDKSGVPSYAACFFKDGASWCCVRGDFINLQESSAGFGDTMDQALNDLARQEHVLHGGWLCEFCKYDGQDNQQHNRFCARCYKHR